MRKLAQGIDQATRGLREPNHGRRPVTTARAPVRRPGLPAADDSVLPLFAERTLFRAA